MDDELPGTEDELGFDDELAGLLLEETGIELAIEELDDLDELLFGQSGQVLPSGQLSEEALEELLFTTDELDTPHPFTTPKGAGCEAQVALEIQLWPFS